MKIQKKIQSKELIFNTEHNHHFLGKIVILKLKEKIHIYRIQIET